MQITISGHQVDTGDALRQHVEKNLSKGLKKYFEGVTTAQVTFSKDGGNFQCDCSAHLATGTIERARGENAEIYAAFELALDRLKKQLRRYKRKIRNHHHD